MREREKERYWGEKGIWGGKGREDKRSGKETNRKRRGRVEGVEKHDQRVKRIFYISTLRHNYGLAQICSHFLTPVSVLTIPLIDYNIKSVFNPLSDIGLNLAQLRFDFTSSFSDVKDFVYLSTSELGLSSVRFKTVDPYP